MIMIAVNIVGAKPAVAVNWLRGFMMNVIVYLVY